MALVRNLFRATLLLWGATIVTALAGYVFDVEVLTAISFGLRRFAPAVTLVWFVVAIGRMLWVRYWPFRGKPR